jgi:hypothetical protein
VSLNSADGLFVAYFEHYEGSSEADDGILPAGMQKTEDRKIVDRL